jgi:hypothetical protein
LSAARGVGQVLQAEFDALVFAYYNIGRQFYGRNLLKYFSTRLNTKGKNDAIIEMETF